MKIKPIEELTFIDDFMFNRVMQDAEICKELLERLLKIKIAKIEYPELQKEIRPYYSTKGIRLDVYVKDSDRIFDVEMQTTLFDNIPRRMRYYQSMVDVDSLMRGEDYSSLKESFIIFLCTEDPLKLSLPCYTFKSVCIEDKTCILGDGTTKIFFNAKAAESEKDVETRAFLGYLLNGKSCDTFTDKIDSLVARLKDNERFRSEYMAGALFLRDAKKEGYEEGFALGTEVAKLQQKAEDEKLLQETVLQLTAQKDAEIQRLIKENEKLKSKL